MTKLQLYRDKKRYEVILHDRFYLTDYEREQLIPELKSRLNVLKGYFREIIDLCDIQKNSGVFNQAVLSIINPNNFEADPNSPQRTPAEEFFNGIKEVAQTQGVDDIDEILNNYSTIENTKHLGNFLTEVNNFCSALAVVNNNLLLYKIETYPYLTNVKTGQTAVTFPPQYTITIEPFQILVTNIVGVAKATSETINEWHKYAMKLKLDYLNLYTKRLSIINTRWLFGFNILTIILAVSLSAFFLFANDPFNLLKENRKLKSEVMMLKEEVASLKTKGSLMIPSAKHDSAIKIVPYGQR